jgi:hypothetical protein
MAFRQMEYITNKLFINGKTLDQMNTFNDTGHILKVKRVNMFLCLIN